MNDENFDSMNNYQKNRFEQARIFFEDNFMGSEDNYYPKICEIHNAYDSLYGDSDRHNCIACNFADSIWLLKYFFDRIENYQSIHDAYFEYMLRLYLIVERMYEVFKIIELPDAYRLKHFHAIKKIHKWANFIKHPKAFLYTHHPEFLMEGEPVKPNSQLINSEFVQKFYSGEKKNKELFTKLSNNIQVVVAFPEPSQLISNFSVELNRFKDVVCNNDVYKEILSEHSNYENYFEKMDEEEI